MAETYSTDPAVMERRDKWIPVIEDKVRSTNMDFALDDGKHYPGKGNGQPFNIMGDGVDPHVIEAMINLETGWSWDESTNNQGTLGLMQITENGREFGLWNEWHLGDTYDHSEMTDGNKNLNVGIFGFAWRYGESWDRGFTDGNKKDQIAVATEWYGCKRNDDGSIDEDCVPYNVPGAPTAGEYATNLRNYIEEVYGKDAVEVAEGDRDTIIDDGKELVAGELGGVVEAISGIGSKVIIGGIVLGAILVGGVLSIAIIQLGKS